MQGFCTYYQDYAKNIEPQAMEYLQRIVKASERMDRSRRHAHDVKQRPSTQSPPAALQSRNNAE